MSRKTKEKHVMELTTQLSVCLLVTKTDESMPWITPLVSALSSTGFFVSFIDPTNLTWDLNQTTPSFTCIMNRARDATTGTTVKTISSYLRFLDSQGILVFNGHIPFSIGNSKVNQITVLKSLGLPFPPSVVVSNIDQLRKSGQTMKFPILVKPDEGGMGSGILKLSSIQELEEYASKPENITKHNNGIFILQQYLRPHRDFIYRVWFLGKKIQGAIQTPVPFQDQTENTECFNTCVCTLQARPLVTIKTTTIPSEIEEEILRIVEKCSADMGSVEYLVLEDGSRYYFDVNMLSTLPDPEKVVDELKIWDGFSPWNQVAQYVHQKCILAR